MRPPCLSGPLSQRGLLALRRPTEVLDVPRQRTAQDKLLIRCPFLGSLSSSEMRSLSRLVAYLARGWPWPDTIGASRQC